MHFGKHMKAHFYSGIEPLEQYLSEGRAKQLEASGAIRDGLVQSEAELKEFADKHIIPPFNPPLIQPGTILPCYIGVDGGSTSSKLVILDENGDLIYKDYLLSKGNPIIDIRDMFSRIEQWTKKQKITLEIKGTAVTGYASSILKTAFNFDLPVVETVAHMRAAVTYYGDIDIICDTGGQDI